MTTGCMLPSPRRGSYNSSNAITKGLNYGVQLILPSVMSMAHEFVVASMFPRKLITLGHCFP